jgi:ABC-type antimicrobial peptide transport system permease subunit
VSGIGLPIESFYADFSPPRIIFAFVFGIAVSALAGLYPAYLAAKLKPVEALRYV